MPVSSLMLCWHKGIGHCLVNGFDRMLDVRLAAPKARLLVATSGQRVPLAALLPLSTTCCFVSCQANPAYTEALSRSQAANVMSFQYSSGQDVSILVSKNGGRYRLQADCFQAIWLVMQVGAYGFAWSQPCTQSCLTHQMSAEV